MPCAIRVEVEDFILTGQFFREHQTASMFCMYLGEELKQIVISILRSRTFMPMTRVGDCPEFLCQGPSPMVIRT